MKSYAKLNKTNSILDQLYDFKQELTFIMRSTHCLVEDTQSLTPDLIMGMLHTERRIIMTLTQIIHEVENR